VVFRRLQGIMVVLFIKTNMQSKMTNASTMITRGHVSKKELAIPTRLSRRLAETLYSDLARQRIHANLLLFHASDFLALK